MTSHVIFCLFTSGLVFCRVNILIDKLGKICNSPDEAEHQQLHVLRTYCSLSVPPFLVPYQLFSCLYEALPVWMITVSLSPLLCKTHPQLIMFVFFPDCGPPMISSQKQRDLQLCPAEAEQRGRTSWWTFTEETWVTPGMQHLCEHN